MNDDNAFLAAVTSNPSDNELRQVYADWLEEQGDPRGEFLRLEAQLPTLSPKERWAARERLELLKGRIGPGWLALMDRTAVAGCFHFEFQCPQRWESLKLTDDASVRFCETCRKRVFHCSTVRHAQRHALRGHCVAIDSTLVRKPGDLKTDITRDPEATRMMMGRFAPPAPRYSPGQRVTIRRGTGKGLVGEIQRVHLSDLRVTVSVQLRDGPASLDLAFEDLEQG